MRIVTQQEFGGPEVLTIVDAPAPRLLPTEVLVRVKAIGLNPLEARLRAGEFPLLGPPPFILGWDVSGVVEEVLTSRFQPGDEVFGMSLFPRPANAYAELVAAPALHLAHKPPSLSHVEAAALPVAGLTAWQGLVDLGGVTEGDRVLVHGGGGGVGHVAIQIAKALGAHVITTASPGKREFVERLGADEVIDYTAVDVADVVRDVDLVLDTLGGDIAAQSLGVLRPGGHLVTAVAEGDVELVAAFERAGMRFSGVAVDPDPVALRGLVDLVERGKLRVHVQETIPFDRVADAHRVLDAGHLQGNSSSPSDLARSSVAPAASSNPPAAEGVATAPWPTYRLVWHGGKVAMAPFDVLVADERTQLEAFIEDYRTAVESTLDGLTDEQARRRLVPSATTLLGLLKHVTWMQRVWFEECIGGRSRRELGLVNSPDESFRLADDDTIVGVREAYRHACATARTTVAHLPLDAVVTGHRGGPRTVHWVYLQVLRELAHHCGHADILREQILAD